MNEKTNAGLTLLELLFVLGLFLLLVYVSEGVNSRAPSRERISISRAKADMRSLATAIESYAVDHGNYPDVDPATLPPPLDHRFSEAYSRAALKLLTTPVSYVTEAKLLDPFRENKAPFHYANLRSVTERDFRLAIEASGGDGPTTASQVMFDSPAMARFRDQGYVLRSVGPDGEDYLLTDASEGQGFARAFAYLSDPGAGVGWNLLYNPTNGTASTGDIVRTANGVLN